MRHLPIAYTEHRPFCMELRRSMSLPHKWPPTVLHETHAWGSLALGLHRPAVHPPQKPVRSKAIEGDALWIEPLTVELEAKTNC
jgi:hypothetical protein